MVTIFIFDGVTLKTSHRFLFTFRLLSPFPLKMTMKSRKALVFCDICRYMWHLSNPTNCFILSSPVSSSTSSKTQHQDAFCCHSCKHQCNYCLVDREMLVLQRFIAPRWKPHSAVSSPRLPAQMNV